MFEMLLRHLMAPAPPLLDAGDCRLALAALLVRIARSDGLYAAEEVERIEKILAARYGLDPLQVAQLRGEAETLETEAPDTQRFTKALKEAVPLEERDELLVALWQIALIDGLRDPEEDALIRMLSRFLGFNDLQNAQARQRAQTLI